MFLHVYSHLNHVSASINLENHLMIFLVSTFLMNMQFPLLEKNKL
jgi:hypothetical protein